MNPPNHFTTRASAWLREQSGFELGLAPSTPDATRVPTRLHGRWQPRDVEARAGFSLVLLLFMVAGVAAMVSNRAGVGAALALGAQVVAAVCIVGALAMLVLDARRARARAVHVDVLVFARTGAREPPLTLARIEPHTAAPGRALWIVSEPGFADETLAALRGQRVRCFASRAHRIVELVDGEPSGASRKPKR